MVLSVPFVKNEYCHPAVTRRNGLWGSEVSESEKSTGRCRGQASGGPSQAFTTIPEPYRGVDRMDDNEAIFKRILDDPEFQATLMEPYAIRIYRRARAVNE